jgi:hypothetical protein
MTTADRNVRPQRESTQMATHDGEANGKDECIVPSDPVPAQELDRYSVSRDPHSE